MLSLVGTLLFYITPVKAQNKPSASGDIDTSKTKGLGLLAAAKAATTIKPYKEVVPASAKTMKSFITVHQVADRYLFEIPDSMLKRDILIVSRVDKNPAGFTIPLVDIGYAGDEVGKAVISFEKIPGDKIALRSLVFNELSNDTSQNGMARSLSGRDFQSILGTFPVKAVNKDAKSTVIDLTDFINADNSVISFGIPFIRNLLANLIVDRSYIDDVHAYPNNIEIKAVKTYNMKPTPIGGTPPPISYEFNSSLVLLPSLLMKPRLADPRIGFFSNSYVDFDANPHGVATTKYIMRWRMEPRAEDMEKYKRGELVEPKKPIVIYIDPATPKKWVPYLIQGINDWQAAFEKAGFKDAIIGKIAPVSDSTWSLEDARHSVLVYKPSDVPNASGPNINDPRTGEILETHINWYHSVMTLVQNWYTIQAGAIDPRARHADLDDELMGELIRFVSSHEIGHTLGLMHNFGASSTVPVANLRNKAWVEAHGHTPSIMDYARFNYVAQPEDHISEKGIFPRIGDYDKWAIEWGYKLIPEAKTAQEEKPILNKWLVNKLASGKQYFYGSQLDPITNDFPINSTDPRDQSEDLGDDAMLASAYGIKNLKRVEPHLIEWLQKPGENYDRAGDAYTELVNEYTRFMGHVLRNIGGIYETPKTVEQPGTEYELEDKVKQERAMAFLNQQLFTTPYWLMDNKLYQLSKTGFTMVTKVQKKVLLTLLTTKLPLLLSEEENFPGKAYTATAMLQDLHRGIFAELPPNKPVSAYRRDLQKTYVEGLIALLDPKTTATDNDALSIAKAHAKMLEAELRKAAARTPRGITHDHFVDLSERLELALHPKSV
ncbi:zinc-dependent metalloprotease [Mucilaginibacter sp. E4BP6]|uniref:zinc-dependent metalloprotease n=1 Tax=Mucilaginibacter sp. E4BP6 TaxID=2723089 RepID=UPI003B008B98